MSETGPSKTIQTKDGTVTSGPEGSTIQTKDGTMSERTFSDPGLEALFREKQNLQARLTACMNSRRADEAWAEARLARVEENAANYRDAANREADNLAARLARAEGALERYGQHDSDCPIEHGPSRCTCGLIAALSDKGLDDG